VTAISTQTSDVPGTDQGATSGGQGVARTLPPLSATASGTALTNSLTATSILHSSAKAVLPANYLTVGKVLRISASGIISNIVTSPGTLTLDVRFGSTVVFNGGAVTLNAVAKTNVSFDLRIYLTCRAVGSGTSANLMGIGALTSESVVGAAAGTTLTASLPASAPAVGSGFDSTAAQTVDLFATFSVANSGNSIQVHEYTIEPVTS
jgi:hypothetical protein